MSIKYSDDDVQAVAEDQLGRRLTDDELDQVWNGVSYAIGEVFRDAVRDAVMLFESDDEPEEVNETFLTEGK